MHLAFALNESAFHGQANLFVLNILQTNFFVIEILESKIKVDPKLSLYS